MVIVNLKVQPSSSMQKIVYMDDGRIKVYLTSQPEKNKANKELVKFISNKLNISKRNIKILNGRTSKNKKLEIRNISAKEFKNIIE
ncbi:MAG: DUF167 domain-containing protein [Elusimicrobiota bacterium]